MKYEIINSQTLDSFIVPKEDFKILKELGEYKFKRNDCNGAIIRNVILTHDDYVKETELFTKKKNYIIFDKWFEEVNYCRLELIINDLKDISSEDELRSALYDFAFVTRIDVDDIVNDTIDYLREIVEDGEFEGIITYNELYKSGINWINNRYGDICDLLNDYFNQ